MHTEHDRPPIDDDAIAAIPSCALDADGRRRQYARYRRLAAAVSRLDRMPDTISVRFDDRFERDVLERALAVERECCPFFMFEFDDDKRRLKIAVSRPDQLPALDALAAAFTDARGAGGGGPPGSP